MLMHQLGYRLPTSILLAFAATTALFYLMNALIQTQQVNLEPIESSIIELVKARKMEPLPVRNTTKLPPPTTIEPPKPEIHFDDGISITVYVAPDPIVVLRNDLSFGHVSDGEHLPLVQVQPSYPRSALARGIEGFTIMEFDISPEGYVQNARVIEAEPSNIFNAASLKAINKFKYKPKVVDGVGQTVYGARNVFRFELAGG